MTTAGSIDTCPAQTQKHRLHLAACGQVIKQRPISATCVLETRSLPHPSKFPCIRHVRRLCCTVRAGKPGVPPIATDVSDQNSSEERCAMRRTSVAL